MTPEDLPQKLRRVQVDENDCWHWQGHLNPEGYGRAYYAGKSTTAHRAVWMAVMGEIADGLQVDHLCRVRDCVNPAHLEPVTPAENVRRSPLVTGYRDLCGAGLHEMTDENVVVISTGGRNCRACRDARQRIYGRAWKEANRERQGAYEASYRERHREELAARRRTEESRAKSRASTAKWRAKKKADKENSNA